MKTEVISRRSAMSFANSLLEESRVVDRRCTPQTETDDTDDSDSGFFRTSSKPSDRSSVRFSKVRVREYAVTVGDVPNARGIPLSLDWQHSEELTLDISEHEACQSGNARRLSRWERRSRLSVVTGFSRKEILAELRRIRKT
jgi:hypothetical protein